MIYEFESPVLPGSLKIMSRIIEYFKIDQFGITNSKHILVYKLSQGVSTDEANKDQVFSTC
jgi:hypothetical protein